MAMKHLLRLPSLTRLRLENLIKVPLDAIATNVKHLSLEKVSWKSVEESAFSSSLPPAIEVLISDYAPSTKALLSSIRPDNQPVVLLKSLTQVEVGGINQDALETCRLVASTSTVLTVIRLKYPIRNTFAGLYDAISPSFDTLRHLVLVTSGNYQNPDPYQDACEELQKMTNTKIQSITFRVITECDLEGTIEDNWDQIDKLLTSEVNWPCLTEVQVEVKIWRFCRPKSAFDETMKNLSKLYFKRLLASKRIHFVYECHNDRYLYMNKPDMWI
ncbi:hypothetical protein CPB83DRAFT_897950 [Crepidotus variabilis]|uniref:Uncharacterized protein n=1 Tax=Crepidotus variabilis TaxID=179855 RepID=A0A9P6JKV7_9AGAR|nr:hypothetical protein CPB83DRAFT_897950 [Crepidotus variabilis]